MVDGAKNYSIAITHATSTCKIILYLLLLHPMQEAQNILDFWFGLLTRKTDIPADKASMWFVNGADYDHVIREKFLSLHNQAQNGQLAHWQNSAKNLLALIILLDQFSRHIYRSSAQSFAQDEQAIYLVKEGIDAGYDRKLFFVERQFFYMPIMHAEDIGIQDISVKMFTDLKNEVPSELRETYTKILSFAESHRFVISKFGRFPELNEILNRKSSESEIEFLNMGEYRFL